MLSGAFLCFLFNGCSDMHILPPLGRRTVISPIFVHGNDFLIFDLNKGNCVACIGFIPGPDAGRSDDQIASLLNSLHFPIPLAGIFTVCPDEFFDGKLFIGAMPSNYGIRMKPASYGCSILIQYIPPETPNIHVYRSLHGDIVSFLPFVRNPVYTDYLLKTTNYPNSVYKEIF